MGADYNGASTVHILGAPKKRPVESPRIPEVVLVVFPPIGANAYARGLRCWFTLLKECA